MATLVPSACPYDCPDCCGLLAEVEGGRVVAVRGNDAHPYSQGLALPQDGPLRTDREPPGPAHPPAGARPGPKGEGKFRRASWDEAIDLVAGRWKAIAAAHGPEAILPVLLRRDHGAGAAQRRPRLLPPAGRLAAGADHLLARPRTPASKAILGDTLGLDPSVVAGGDLIVLWGVNAVATNLHLLPYVKEARKQGARVWLVDTHRDRHRRRWSTGSSWSGPARDGALCLGLIHLLAREGLAAEPFLAERGAGLAELEAAVLADHPPARTDGAHRARRGRRCWSWPAAWRRPGRPSSASARGCPATATAP